MGFWNFNRSQLTLLSVLAVATVGSAALVPIAHAQAEADDWYSQMDDQPGPGPGGPEGGGQPGQGPGQGQGQGRGGDRGGRGGGMLRNLNLSAEQTQKLNQVREQFRTRMQQQQEAIRNARQEMGKLMAGSATADQLRQQHNRLQAEMQKMGDLRFESMLAMREILTPEQRQQLAQRMQERGPGSGRHGGGPGGRGQGQQGQPNNQGGGQPPR